MVEEAYVSFEIAKLLKEKGFDETCYACYEYFSSAITMYSGWPFEYKGEIVHNSNNRIKCPTQQMAMRWLREVHNIHINVCYDSIYFRHYKFYCCLGTKEKSDARRYDTYEETLEAAVKYCLEKLVV